MRRTGTHDGVVLPRGCEAGLGFSIASWLRQYASTHGSARQTALLLAMHEQAWQHVAKWAPDPARAPACASLQAQRVLPVPLGVQAMLLPGPKAAVGLAFRRAAPPGGTGTWGGGGGGGGGGPLAMSGAQLVAPRPAASTDGPAPPGIGAGGGAAGEGAGPSESRSRWEPRRTCIIWDGRAHRSGL